MRRLSTFVLTAAVAFASTLAEARQVNVWYVDAGRPTAFSQTQVIASIQRALRQWETYSAYSPFAFKWGGMIPLSAAPADFNNIVVRWTGAYTNGVAFSCPSAWTCTASGKPDVPTNHILLSTAADGPGLTWNNPIWVPDQLASSNLDLYGDLMHELGHLLRNATAHYPSSVLIDGASFPQRSLWNSDIAGVDTGRYDGRPQALELFGVDYTTGSTSLLTQWQPYYRVRSPAAIAIGSGGISHYALAWSTVYPAGADGLTNALLFRSTDGTTNTINNVDTPIFAYDNGQMVARTYHRPCVAVSATGSDAYVLWASPLQDVSGSRSIYAVESHNGGATWSGPETLPWAATRTGVSCSIDRATERLVVVYSGSAQEGIFLNHRPSLVAGPGQWATQIRLNINSSGFTASTPETPEIAFDFFSTSSPGRLTWQDNADMLVHSIAISFSGGTYVPNSSNHVIVPYDTTLLRSFAVMANESSLIVGASEHNGSLGFQDETRFIPASAIVTGSYSPVFMHRFTSGASNRVLFQKSFLSTSIIL